MTKHRVSISGKVDKSRQLARQEVEATNIRDAVLQALDKAGLDGFSTGEFSIKVSQPDGS